LGNDADNTGSVRDSMDDLAAYDESTNKQEDSWQFYQALSALNLQAAL
jgi:aminoglycoside phosphotransferase (APT) family kinase protein